MHSSLAPGATILGKYQVEEVLGQGGMGVVVRARHLELGEVVAVKILSDELPGTHEFFARFMREARAAARLRTQHVVEVFDVGRLDNDLPYMVMELLDGVDFYQMIKQGGTVDPRLAATVAFQTCEALAEAHALGIVHRDIKPSNLFVIPDRDGHPFVKLLDFGIAKAEEASGERITRTHMVLGTPSHMSPEQLRSSHAVDGRTDLWALGVVLYEALEGRRPFPARTLPELTIQIAIEAVPEMTRTASELRAVVMRCLEKEPDNRYQSALELAAALVPFVDDPVRAHSDLEVIERLVRDATLRLPEITPVSVSEPQIVSNERVAPITPVESERVSTAPARPGGGRLQERTASLAPSPPIQLVEPVAVANVSELRPRVTRRALAIAAGLCAIAAVAIVILTTNKREVVVPAPDAAPIAAEPVVDKPKRVEPTIVDTKAPEQPVQTEPKAQPPVKKRTPPTTTAPVAETPKPAEPPPAEPIKDVPPAKDKPADWMEPK